MIRFLDTLLDHITMYRLVLYILIALLIFATVFSFFGILSYPPQGIIFSTLFILLISLCANYVFSYVFRAPTNTESVYITALILALVINPTVSVPNFMFMGWAAVLATASKYILALKKKHIFNPVAIAVVLTSFVSNQSASWWVGNVYLTPLVIMGGILVVRKIQREDLVFSFLITVLVLTSALGVFKGTNILNIFNQVLFHSSLFFFGFIMLTEPLTTPPTKNLRIIDGILTGMLFIPQVHLGSVYSTPELALIIGNIFAYIVSPKQKLILYLHEKISITAELFDFIFVPKDKLAFVPGQYMEWTLAHPHTDDRGNRRYFTIASSPTETQIRLGVRFYQQGSSYKKQLLHLDENTPIVASQLAGDFTLPKDPQQKSVFIAGGIGITPFRSMIKYLVDTKQRRDIVLIYSNKFVNEIMYKDVFDQAEKELGIKTIYSLTDLNSIPSSWQGKRGRINGSIISQEIPDYLERKYYLSGPHSMVTAFEDTLTGLHIPSVQIKTDFFPGFA